MTIFYAGTFSTGATLINPNYTTNELIEPVVTYYNY